MPRQCDETVNGVRCVHREGHGGDCTPPVPIQYEVMEPSQWRELKSYDEAGDEQGFALYLRDLCEFNVDLWNIAVRGKDPVPYFTGLRQKLDEYPKLQVEVFRGGSKSTYFTEGDLSHHLAFSTLESSDWYGWTGLLVRENADAAEKTMWSIRDVFTENDVVKRMFGNLKEGNKKWTGKVLWPSGLDAVDMPPLQALGPGGEMTGDHPTDAYFDDVVTEKNSSSKTERQNMWDWWSSAIEGVVESSRERHMFTPYRDDDLNARLKDQNVYKHIEVPALSQRPDRERDIEEIIYDDEEEEEVIMDIVVADGARERLDPKLPCPMENPSDCVIKQGLPRTRHWNEVGFHRGVKYYLYQWLKNPTAFYEQWMLEQVAGDEALVEEDWLRFYAFEGDTRIGTERSPNGTEVVKFPSDNLLGCVHGWDHAIGQKKKNDDTAFAKAFRDHDNRIFYDVWSDKLKSTKTAQKMEQEFYNTARRWGIRPSWIVTEGVNFQRHFANWIEEEADEIINVDVVKNPSDKAAEFTETGFQGAILRGQVHFHVDDGETFQQFKQFTGEEGKTDDRVDACRLAYTKIRQAIGKPVRSHQRNPRGRRRGTGRFRGRGGRSRGRGRGRG